MRRQMTPRRVMLLTARDMKQECGVSTQEEEGAITF
jgi:hypothetical protein